MKWLNKIAQHPILVVGGYLMGIVGLVMAYQAFEKPDICWTLGAPQLVVAPQEDSELAVTFGGGAITGAVSALQLEIWNHGNKPVRSSDILSGVRVTSGEGRVLKAKVVKQSRTLIGVEIFDAKTNGCSFRWEILEPDDGFVVQFLLAGSTNTSLSVDGAFERQRTIRNVNRSSTKMPWWVFLGAIVFMLGSAKDVVTEVRKLRALRFKKATRLEWSWQAFFAFNALIFAGLVWWIGFFVLKAGGFSFASRPPLPL
jgi:hypothetical protein